MRKYNQEYSMHVELEYRRQNLLMELSSNFPILNFWIYWAQILCPLMESQNDGILKKISSYKSVDMGKVGSVRVAKKKT